MWLWLVRRRDLGRSLFAAVFPEFIAREKPGLRGTGRQGRSAGLVRPAVQRGLGPARLDGQAPQAKVAGESDELGERRTAVDGPGYALKPTPRGERLRVPAARLAGCQLADQVQPVRRHCRGDKQRAAGMGCPADPLEGKRGAQASPTTGRERWKPERREMRSGSMPCTTARPGNAGRRKGNSDRNAELPKCEASGICPLMSADFPCHDGEHL